MKTAAKRLAYLGYYVREMNWPLLSTFMAHVRDLKGWSKAGQWRRIIRDSLRFNISPLEYYQFRFFELSDTEKTAWAGTGTMYEFQLAANPVATRDVLRDKRNFYKTYQEFFRHRLYSLKDLESDLDLRQRLIDANEQLVFKDSLGNCGDGVVFVPTAELSADGFIDSMRVHGCDLVETFVHQHPDLDALSPSGVNTVRIFTQIDSTGQYSVLGCRLRITVNCRVDNLAAGNIAAPIDETMGVISGPAVYSDITRPAVDTHPVTGHPITGFQVPFWEDALQLVRQASLLNTANRSVGWDLVITRDGPGLIEGNHDWCKLVWQLPVERGLKHRLDIDQ